jgi:hypothetical protein
MLGLRDGSAVRMSTRWYAVERWPARLRAAPGRARVTLATRTC